MGYVTAMETLKIVTKTSIVDVNTAVIEEKYKVLSPEIMHETLLSDSEDDDAGDDDFLDHNHYKYMETDDLKANCVGADQKNFDTTNPDHHDHNELSGNPSELFEKGNIYMFNNSKVYNIKEYIWYIFFVMI